MNRYRFTSAALTELRQATLYYEQREKDLGTAFLYEIEATLSRILEHPHAWHPLSARTTLSNSSLSVWLDLSDPYV
jgi:hypothetical protein